MKLHRNAALSLKKRELLCDRVVGEEWSLTEAAAAAEVSERTARKWVRRYLAGLGKLWRLDQEQVVRYERSRPGELIHVDVKKLGRIQGGAGHRMTGRRHYTPTTGGRRQPRKNTVGWEFCHIAIDDFSRLAYVELLEDERATTAVGFLRRAVKFFAANGIRVEAVMTDG